MRKHKNKIIAGVIIAALLMIVFLYGGNAPETRDGNSQPDITNISETQTPLPSQTAAPLKVTDEPEAEKNKPQNTDGSSAADLETSAPTEEIPDNFISQPNSGTDTNTGIDINQADPVPAETENMVISDKELTCTLSVRCDTILGNLELLDKEKLDIVPKDGVIYKEQTVIFYEGESVFNLLVREMKRKQIHLEFVNTPVYNSAYIEGIANLYEFDCGELSGWMYKVNDQFPNYGCSRYQLKEGDRVEWVYTCDLGNDVGDNYSTRNGR